jgi:2-polyprenyl-3-methyl-5-hydroxy-6-metoxy-1,4-benzoquinol methylase
MLWKFDCPACARHDNWEKITSYVYSRSEAVARPVGGWSDYVRLRRQILFDVWCPEDDVVTLESIMCCACGFVCYTPRPTQSNVDAKYRFLQKTERTIGGQRPERRARAADQRRAERVFNTVTRHTSDGRLRVLDFGGGNGKLLQPFVEAGHLCVLVDYNVEPLPGIQKVGDTLDDVPEGDDYDVIICSHVLEHLAEPAQTVRRLAKHLSSRGVIYGEVPLGIWKDIGIASDPVTHVNFFNKNSFENLFGCQGLDVLEATQTVGQYNRRMDVLIVVATKSCGSRRTLLNRGTAETRRLLNPTIAMEIHRRWRLRLFPGRRAGGRIYVREARRPRTVTSDSMERTNREREQYNQGLQRERYVRMLRHSNYYYGIRERQLRTEALRFAHGKTALELGSTSWKPWLDAEDIEPSRLDCINISERELEKGLKLARNSRLQPNFHLMDANKLAYQANTFDVVFGWAILHHLDFTTALGEVCRVLKPNGVAVFKEPLGTNPVATIVRLLTPKARTVDEQPLRFRELADIRKRFDCSLQMMQFLSVPFGVLSGLVFKSPANPLTFLSYKVDRTLETLAPPIRYFYRQVLIIGRKRDA